MTGQQQDTGGTLLTESMTEDLHVAAEEVTATVKKLLHDGNVRRIVVKNDREHVIIEIPVTAGVVIALAAPILVAVAALAAVVKDFRIEVQRMPEAPHPA